MKDICIYSILAVLIFFGCVCSFYSCTENQRAKKYGGTMQINLPAGQKLETITFKDANVWYLTRPMLPTDSAVTHTFKEESNFGVLSGTILIHETKN